MLENYKKVKSRLFSIEITKDLEEKLIKEVKAKNLSLPYFTCQLFERIK